MLLAARRDEDFDTCGFVPASAPCHCRAHRGSIPPPRPPAPSHGRQLRTAALHLCLRALPSPWSPGSTPPPAAPCSAPVATATSSCTAALHLLRRASPRIHALPCRNSSIRREGGEGRGGSAPPRALAPWAEHQKGGSRRRGEGRLHGLGNGRSAGWVGGGEWDGLRGEWRCREPSGREIEDGRENNYYEVGQTQRVGR